MTSMPAIHIGALSIGREDREGNNGSGVATEDDDDTDAEAGGYARNFLEVVLRRLWEGRFGRNRTTTKTTETSRDDDHEEDIVTRVVVVVHGSPEAPIVGDDRGVRYPLSSYVGIWNSHVGTLPLLYIRAFSHVSGTWHTILIL